MAQRADPPAAGKPEMVSLGTQLERLAEAGVRLSPGLDVGDLLTCELLDDFEPREQLEQEPWLLTLCCLGCETSSDDPVLLSDDVFYFDCDSVEDGTNYLDLVDRLAWIADGDLPVEAVDAGVDRSTLRARVVLRVRGELRSLELRVDDDWVDLDLLYQLAAIHQETSPRKVFWCLDVEGQSCLAGFSLPADFKRLRQLTKLDLRDLALT